MKVEDIDKLKAWLTRVITPICDADPIPLAKYIVALVKKDKPEQDLRDTCNDQLDVFLQKETKPFVDLLIKAVKDGSYLEGDGPSLSPAADLPKPAKAEEADKPQSPTRSPSPRRNRSRERSRERYKQPCRRKMHDERGGRSKRFYDDRRSRRSRSRSKSPRERRRSRSKEKAHRDTPDSRSSTPTQDNGLESNKKLSYDESRGVWTETPPGREPWEPPAGPTPGERKPRCRDFDEKGFCMRGEFCPYDHGVDPVVVEDVNIPKMLSFPSGAPGAGGQPGQPGPLPPGQGMFSQPPPGVGGPPPGIRGPPPPNLGGPPEAMHIPGPPGIPRPPVPRGMPDMRPPPPGPQRPQSVPAPQMVQHQRLPGTHMRPPGPGHPGPRHQGMPPEPYNPEAPRMNAPGSFHSAGPFSQPPPNHRRDHLVNIPTETGPRHEQAGRIVLPLKRPHEPTPHRQPGGQYEPRPRYPGYGFPPRGRGSGRAGFDHSRLGGGSRYNIENTTLNVKKIPADFNNITKLNEHFSKFGAITNIQVCYEGDPESAQISFASHWAAKAAYSCPDPVFNNRFIRVFWHNKQNPDNQEQTQVSEQNNQPSIQDRLGVRSSINNNLNHRNLDNRPRNEEDKTSISATTHTTTTTDAIPPQDSQRVEIQENPKVKQEEKIKEATKKKLEIKKQKYVLLQKQIEQQKLLLQKLEGSKNMSADNKTTIMKTIKALAQSIDKLKAELLPKTSSGKDQVSPKTKQQLDKEMLDTELELMSQQNAGGDTGELAHKMVELKKEAATLGYPVRGRGRGAFFATRGRGRGRGHIIHPAARSVDRRPKQLFVQGFEVGEEEELVKHFSHFGTLESVEHDESIPSAVLTFKTRKDAEMAVTHGQEFKDQTLRLAWYKPPTPVMKAERKLSTTSDPQAESHNETEEADEDELLAGDDDEDDDEDRGWKR